MTAVEIYQSILNRFPMIKVQRWNVAGSENHFSRGNLFRITKTFSLVHYLMQDKHCLTKLTQKFHYNNQGSHFQACEARVNHGTATLLTRVTTGQCYGSASGLTSATKTRNLGLRFPLDKSPMIRQRVCLPLYLLRVLVASTTHTHYISSRWPAWPAHWCQSAMIDKETGFTQNTFY